MKIYFICVWVEGVQVYMCPPMSMQVEGGGNSQVLLSC